VPGEVANRGVACWARLLCFLIMRRVASSFGSNRARGRERKKQGEENKKLLFPCCTSRGRRRRNSAASKRHHFIFLIIIIIFLYIILFYLFFILFFIFFVFSLFLCGDPKMSYNRCSLFTILTEHRLCKVSFVKINKSELPKLISSQLG
jgi:magnesium-transporting ATPase (P-type)